MSQVWDFGEREHDEDDDNSDQMRTDLIRKVENEVVKSEKRDTVARLKAIFYM